MKYHLDFETRSSVDLEVVGTWAYAAHPSTEIIAMGFGTTRDNVVVLPREHFTHHKPIPAAAAPLLAPDLIISAHAAHFEIAVWEFILHRKLGWPRRWAPSLWRCTMAKAFACGLPGKLDKLGNALKLKTLKDLQGRAVMLELSKPKYVDPLFGPTYDETPEKYRRMYEYNRVDVVTEIEADEALPDLVPAEQRVWEMDLEMNRRGVRIDVDFARKGAALAQPITERLNTRLHAITCKTPPTAVHGPKTCTGVDAATKVAAIKNYLGKHFAINTASLDKEAVTNLLEDPKTPDVAREMLTIRRQVSKKNSVAKYTAALECVSADGRARGLLQYYAAHTGRWGGRLLQPQNIPKGFKVKEQGEALAAIMASDVDGFLARYGSKSMDALSDALRGLFVADDDKMLVCADFNAIEARVLFWLADEVEALAAYRRGESPYLDMARYIYDRQDITKEGSPVEYDIGKRTILGCGYQMGWKRFKSNIYTETAKAGKPVSISEALAQRAVKAYRKKYHRVRSLWYDVQDAAIAAVKAPGKVFTTCGGRVGYAMSNDRRFLVCRLPSGRFLRYIRPEVIQAWRTFCDDESCPHFGDGFIIDESLCPKRQLRETLTYWGEDTDTKQWVPLMTYGGALVENITQAVARDLLVHGMLNVEAAGYPPVLTVHDEVVSEVNLREHAAKGDVLPDFIKHLCSTPVWAAGCPVAAEGWVRPRYGK